MESSLAPVPHRRSHLPNRTYRSLLHHLCSSFDREPRVSLATPAVLQELVSRTEIAQTCEPGEVYANEKPPENLSLVESRSDGVSGDSRAEKVETISLERKDFFDDFELMMNESEDLFPESCVNLFEPLDVNDYDGDVCMVASLDDIAKQPLDNVQNVVEMLNVAAEVEVDLVEGDKKVSENIGKAEKVLKSVESNEVISSGVLETCNETLQRDMELEKPVYSSTLVSGDFVSRIVEDDDVEEGEISGDDNDDMLVEDDLPVERHEESHVSQVGTGGNSHLTSRKSFGSLSTAETVDEVGKKLGVEVSDVDHRAMKSDHQSFNKEEKMDLGTSIKKRSAPSKESKARKKAKARKKRAQERIALGVKKLKLKPVAPKPKPIKYCRHYLKGRCHEGDECKFSHDTIPETKSSPCCYFATQSCMKGDDCPYDHDLSKYPCNNFITKGFCHRGDSCLFSHKGTPQSASVTPDANVTVSTTNIAAASFSKTNKQTVREAIAKLPSIQARASSSVPFLKPSSQSDTSSSKINAHVAPPPQMPLFKKPSVAPKGMNFLSLDKPSLKESVKPSPASTQTIHNSDDQTLKKSQQGSFLPLGALKGISFVSFSSEERKALNQKPQEPSSSRNLKTMPNSHFQSSLNSAMKLAAEFESAKVERRNNDPAEAVNKNDVKVNTTITRNSGNISSKILEFLSSFSQGKN